MTTRNVTSLPPRYIGGLEVVVEQGSEGTDRLPGHIGRRQDRRNR